MSSAQKTTDHDEIRRWTEARGGHPAKVQAQGKQLSGGILRIDFDEPGGNDDVRLTQRISAEAQQIKPPLIGSLALQSRDNGYELSRGLHSRVDWPSLGCEPCEP
jgi:hypothetical protein